MGTVDHSTCLPPAVEDANLSQNMDSKPQKQSLGYHCKLGQWNSYQASRDMGSLAVRIEILPLNTALSDTVADFWI